MKHAHFALLLLVTNFGDVRAQYPQAYVDAIDQIQDQTIREIAADALEAASERGSLLLPNPETVRASVVGTVVNVNECWHVLLDGALG